MEFSELIEARRSVRKYKAGGRPSEEELRAIISAAQQAPSWKNQQTGRYYAALTDSACDRVRDCLPGFNHDRSENAALVVCTFVKGNVGFDDKGQAYNGVGDGWGCYDLGLQNALLILKARELGYGTLIMGIVDAPGLRAELDIPEQEQIMGVIAIGTPDQAPQKPKRLDQDEILTLI